MVRALISAMASKVALRQAFFSLIMIAMSGCTSTVETGPGTTGVPASCSQNSNVVGCIGGAAGYSCTGSDSPDDGDSALNCSSGTASGGLTLYCCVDTSSVAGCTADSSIVGCGGTSIGFSCTGTAEPSQSDSSLACSVGTASGDATLFCCASYMPSAGTCAQDSTVQGCTGASIGFSCSGADNPAAINQSLVCSTGTPGGAGTQYCCGTGPGTTPVTTTPTCGVDMMVSCAAPSTGYSCTGGVTPTQGNAALSCGTGMAEADGTTLAFCCNTATTPPTPACAADPAVTGCPGDSTGYTCTGGANPMTSSLLCGSAMPGANGAMSFCCTTT
jgi:hypothetical protein